MGGGAPESVEVIKMFRTIYVRREELGLCRQSLKQRRPIIVTDFTEPATPIVARGLVMAIGEDPRQLMPMRWQVTFEVPTPKPPAAKSLLKRA